MRFAAQVRFARLCGVGCLVAGLLCGWASVLLWNAGLARAANASAWMSGPLLLAAAVFLLFGGVVRPIHRWMYSYLKHSTLSVCGMTMRERFTRWFDARFWLWWLHVDREGNDRDARP